VAEVMPRAPRTPPRASLRPREARLWLSNEPFPLPRTPEITASFARRLVWVAVGQPSASLGVPSDPQIPAFSAVGTTIVALDVPIDARATPISAVDPF